MERLKITPESYARKVDFIETAMGEGAHLILPVSKATGITMSKEAWDRIVDIGLLYHLGPETTGQSLANMYGITKEAIRQTRDKFIVNLYENSSDKTKKKFPLKTIILRKPVILPQREKLSERNGGIALKVKSLMQEEGITDAKEITSRLGITAADLRIIMESGMFKRWGLDLHVDRINRSFKEVEDKVNEMTDDKELQEYLDGFSGPSLRSYIYRKDSTQTIFGLLGATLKELGVKNNRYAKPVALKLKADGIPVRLLSGGVQKKGEHEHQKTYFIYFLKQKQRIIDAVIALGSLRKNPEINSLKRPNPESSINCQ